MLAVLKDLDARAQAYRSTGEDYAAFEAESTQIEKELTAEAQAAEELLKEKQEESLNTPLPIRWNMMGR